MVTVVLTQERIVMGDFLAVLDRTINVALRTVSLQQQLYAGMLTVQERLFDRTISAALRTAK